MATIKDREFYDLGTAIVRSVNGFTSLAEQPPKSLLASLDDLDLQRLTDNLRLFAAHTGLFNPGHTSLDYRLRDNQEFRQFTKKLLSRLDDQLKERMFWLDALVLQQLNANC
jgi:hypothetical protein